MFEVVTERLPELARRQSELGVQILRAQFHCEQGRDATAAAGAGWPSAAGLTEASRIFQECWDQDLAPVRGVSGRAATYIEEFRTQVVATEHALD